MQAGRGYAAPRANRNSGYGHASQQQSAAAQQHRMLQEQELQKKREREAQYRILQRPSDRNISDGAAKITIGDGVQRYRKLRDMERRLDATMMQKRLELTDPYRQKTDIEGTFRIWISNTVEGQPWQIIEDHENDGAFDLADNSQATYRVKIEGRLIDDPFEEDEDDKPAGTPRSRLRFSDFFHAIVIDFNRTPSLQADGVSTIEWKRPALNIDPNKPRASSTPESSFDTIQFTRKGDEETNITINLYRDYQPPRYKLSQPLAELLDMTEADTASVIGGIWDYVRANNLQEDDEHRRFICDDALKKIFGIEILTFPQLREIVLTQNHLSELPPVQLPYTIRLDKEYISPSTGSTPSAPTVYDVRVPLPSPLVGAINKLLTHPEHIVKLREIQELDSDIAVIIQAINRATLKHKFFTNLSEDPVRFIKRWFGSQKRDLEIFYGEGGRGLGEDGSLPDALRKGGDKGIWGTEGVREATGVYLARTATRS